MSNGFGISMWLIPWRENDMVFYVLTLLPESATLVSMRDKHAQTCGCTNSLTSHCADFM